MCGCALLTWMPAYMTMSRGFSTLGMGRNLSSPLFVMAVSNLLAAASAGVARDGIVAAGAIH